MADQIILSKISKPSDDVIRNIARTHFLHDLDRIFHIGKRLNGPSN